MCRVERVAALCALALPPLAQPAAAAFSKHGDACAAASVVLLAAPRGDATLISWALQVPHTPMRLRPSILASDAAFISRALHVPLSSCLVPRKERIGGG
jgi:hypothetical protein